MSTILTPRNKRGYKDKINNMKENKIQHKISHKQNIYFK